ncbi:MAG TPA: hypothetical protein VFU91_09730 [Sphingomicrobium sp.]|nr:hypothetical protein [Sphingomicrobium sp.]
MSSAAALPSVGTRIPRIAIRPVHLVIGLALLALAVRVVGLGLRPLWLDEGYSVYAAERTWHDLWTVVPSYETHPPFYYSILKLWSAFFGTSAIPVRSLSVLISVATVPVVIAAAFEVEKQEPSEHSLLRAGLAGLLAACSPMLIYLDQQARPYALMVLAYAIATLGLLKLLREFQSEGAGSLGSWALLTGGTVLTLWSHNLGVLYAFCLASALAPAWLARPFNPSRIKRGLVAATTILLFYAPCLLITAKQVGTWGTSWLTWEPSKLLELFGFYSIPFEVLTIGSVVGALVMLLLVKRAIQHDAAGRGWTSGRALLVLWWGPTILAIVISALYIPVFLARTLAGTLVPAYIALAGVVARTPSPRERLFLAAALSITLLPAAVQTALQPASEKWDLAAAYLRRVVGPADQVWIYPNDSVLALRKAAPGAAYRIRQLPADFPAVSFKGINRSGSPATPSMTQRQAQLIADDPRIRTIPTIWLVTRQIWVFDPSGDLESALIRSRRPGKVQKWGYIEVRPYYAK